MKVFSGDQRGDLLWAMTNRGGRDLEFLWPGKGGGSIGLCLVVENGLG